MKMITEISLLISILVIIFMIKYLFKNRNNSKLHKCLYMIFVLLGVYVASMFAQITLGKILNINLIYFEYITRMCSRIYTSSCAYVSTYI